MDGHRQTVFIVYRGVPKFSDTRKPSCNQPKIRTKMPILRIFHQTDAYGKASSEDLISYSFRSSLIWVCTVCPDLSVRRSGIIVVVIKEHFDYSLRNIETSHVYTVTIMLIVRRQL